MQELISREIGDFQVVKTHSARITSGGYPVICDKHTAGAVYLVRNPLDVVDSLADHDGITVDEAIALMNDPGHHIGHANGELVTQPLSTWSTHVESWLAATSFPVLLIRYEDLWAGHCIDHRFGELHKNYPGGIYVPGRWLVGHRGGQSEIRDQLQPRAFFTSAEELTNPRLDKQIVAVVGTQAAGVTHTAMQLHLNGISMGAVRIANRAPQFEDFSPGLRKLLAVLFDKDWWIPKTDIAHRVQMLRLWACHRATVHSGLNDNIMGACHPQLGTLGSELIDAWREPVFVIVESAEKSSRLKTVQGSAAVQERLLRRGIEEIKTHARHQLCIDPATLDVGLLIKQIIAEFSQM